MITIPYGKVCQYYICIRLYMMCDNIDGSTKMALNYIIGIIKKAKETSLDTGIHSDMCTAEYCP